MSVPRLRSLGVDPGTGRESIADTRPGGLLDALADTHALKAMRRAGDGRGRRAGGGEGVGRRTRRLRTGVVRGT